MRRYAYQNEISLIYDTFMRNNYFMSILQFMDLFFFFFFTNIDIYVPKHYEMRILHIKMRLQGYSLESNNIFIISTQFRISK